MASLGEDLALAHRSADLARETALSYFGRPSRSQTKSDGTPVGEADLAVDRTLVEQLRERRPADAVLSEESGLVGSSWRRWILDSIDGTVVFLAGQPHWGTHIALQDGDEVTLKGCPGLCRAGASATATHRGQRRGTGLPRGFLQVNILCMPSPVIMDSDPVGLGAGL